jgi:hypothetical protein
MLTIFSGFLVIHSNRIKSNRNTFIWCIKHKKIVQKEYEMHEISTPTPNITLNELKNPNDKIYPFLNFIKLFFLKFKFFYKFLITNDYRKYIVALLFGVYLSFSSYNALKIREGMELSNLVAENSYYHAFITENFAEFSQDAPVMMIIYEPIDYTNKTIRKQISQILDEAKAIDGINKEFQMSWLNYFNDEIKMLRKSKNPGEILNKIANTSSPFSNDIAVAFNHSLNKCQIVASRFYLKYEKLSLTSKDAQIMNSLIELCKKVDFGIKPYATGFKVYYIGFLIFEFILTCNLN